MKIKVVHTPSSTICLGDQIDDTHFAWDCQHDGEVEYDEAVHHVSNPHGQDNEWSERRAYCADCGYDVTEKIVF